ncbi:hypothetical protein AURDEDRAFT_171316 [Auricularia subglabra TFB-10046 SS5]|nr:hypothetical protein AURDEDRAFT_171316 [Auricularia subglabra TFB-10046 SS5]
MPLPSADTSTQETAESADVAASTTAEHELAALPCHRLPPELLAECFGHLDFDSVLAASHTCRSWRAVAISCPSLWANIKIHLQQDSSNAARAETAVLELLDRTRAVPVSFRLRVDYMPRYRCLSARRIVDWEEIAKPSPPLDLNVLSPHVSHLRVLKLDLVDDRYILGWEPILRDAIPRLEELSLHFLWETFVQLTDGEKRPIISHSPPSLRRLDISGSFDIGSRGRQIMITSYSPG